MRPKLLRAVVGDLGPVGLGGDVVGDEFRGRTDLLGDRLAVPAR